MQLMETFCMQNILLPNSRCPAHCKYFDIVFLHIVLLQVTYMLEGSCQHEDFCGHRGVIGPGDLQVFTVWNILAFELIDLLKFHFQFC